MSRTVVSPRRLHHHQLGRYRQAPRSESVKSGRIVLEPEPLPAEVQEHVEPILADINADYDGSLAAAVRPFLSYGTSTTPFICSAPKPVTGTDPAFPRPKKAQGNYGPIPSQTSHIAGALGRRPANGNVPQER